MRYLCVIFAFVALLLCGCGSENNITHGTADTPDVTTNITLRVIDKANKPYVTVPITLTGVSDFSGNTDTKGTVDFTDISAGEYTVTLLGSPSMTGTVNVVAGKSDYTVVIDRPMVSGLSFNVTVDGMPEYDDFFVGGLVPANEEPINFANGCWLDKDPDNLFYPRDDKSIALPAGSYYLSFALSIDGMYPLYFSKMISITPESQFPMDVTIYPPVAYAKLDMIDTEGNYINGDWFVCFENQQTGNSYYMLAILASTSLSLPEAGTYNVSVPGFSTDVHEITFPNTEEVKLKFTRSLLEPSAMSFIILKSDETPFLPTDVSNTIHLKGGTNDFPLNYDNGVWKIDGSSLIPVGDYYIMDGSSYISDVWLRNDDKYPITVILW